jgi:hypothetical protein
VAGVDPPEFAAVTTTRIVDPTSTDASWYVLVVAPVIDVQVAPLASHRRHWYVYVTGAVPVQVPVVAVSVCPSCAVPEIVGNEVFAGATPVTTAVALDVAGVEPAAFAAVTTTRSVEPTSAGPTAYVAEVWPETFVQFAPVLSQRRHWYVYVNGGVPDHVPVVAESVCPSCAVPVIAGSAVLLGVAAPTVAVGLDADVAEPPLFEAVTATTSVEPTSPDVA